MPPQIALIICTIFVLWLRRIDHKQAPKVFRALWIPTIWMLVNDSKPVSVWFGTGGADIGSTDTGSPLDRAFLTAFFCLGLIILARRFIWSNAIKKYVADVADWLHGCQQTFYARILFFSMKAIDSAKLQRLVALTETSDVEIMVHPRRENEYLFLLSPQWEKLILQENQV